MGESGSVCARPGGCSVGPGAGKPRQGAAQAQAAPPPALIISPSVEWGHDTPSGLQHENKGSVKVRRPPTPGPGPQWVLNKRAVLLSDRCLRGRRRRKQQLLGPLALGTGWAGVRNGGQLVPACNPQGGWHQAPNYRNN